MIGWLAALTGLGLLGGGGLLWAARRSRLANFGAPARTWATLVAFWRAGSMPAVRSCFTPESLALLEYAIDSARHEPPMPAELVDYLARSGGDAERVYREELPALLRLVRENIGKYWILTPSRPGGPPSIPERRTVLGLLRHILSGLPAEPDRSAPTLKSVDTGIAAGDFEYVRAVHEPMFPGFGCLDTFKRVGPIWLLDLAAPLLEAAHASKTHWMPGETVRVVEGRGLEG